MAEGRLYYIIAGLAWAPVQSLTSVTSPRTQDETSESRSSRRGSFRLLGNVGYKTPSVTTIMFSYSDVQLQLLTKHDCKTLAVTVCHLETLSGLGCTDCTALCWTDFTGIPAQPGLGYQPSGCVWSLASSHEISV